ncbi:MAG: glutamate--cysteine ligase, partial [Bdellovibrionota bacterium]
TLGWHSRKKSEHFKYYNILAGEFAKMIDIDPWLIQVDTQEVDSVDFNEGTGVDRVEASVKEILERTTSAYQRHAIDHKPFVYIKNNAGTYGMGIMVVHSTDEVKNMNRRTKNKMSVGKNKMKIQSVAIQEGVPTATLIDRLPAEPVIYLFGGELIGGFLRTNSEKNAEENLNSPGMVFKMLFMTDLRTELEDEQEEPELELVYGSIARISALAAGLELAHNRKRLNS